jgi:hypothetical protein
MSDEATKLRLHRVGGKRRSGTRALPSPRPKALAVPRFHVVPDAGHLAKARSGGTLEEAES